MPFFGGGGGDYHIIVTNIKGGTDAAPSVVGSNNMALGNGALQNATLCDYNIAIGNSAGNSLTDGGYNVIIGGLAGNALQQSSDTNIIIGYLAAFNSPASSRGNVIIGTGAYSNVALSVDNCVILGVNAQNLSGANNSVTIGANSNSGNNSIAIKGTAGNNAIVIGDASQTTIRIGAFDFSAGPTTPPAGVDTNVQFNSGGAFGADPLFTYSAGVLSTPNAIVGDPGTEGTGITIGGVLYNSVFKVSDISSTDIAQSIIHRHSTTWEPIQVFARSNSNGSGHGVVTNGMLLSSQYTAGWTGTEYNLFGRAGFEAAAAGTISDASSPGDFVIATTPDGGTLPVEAVRIKSDKSIAFNGAVGAAGEVLTSGGVGAPPTWAAPAGGVGIEGLGLDKIGYMSAVGQGLGTISVLGLRPASLTGTASGSTFGTGSVYAASRMAKITSAAAAGSTSDVYQAAYHTSMEYGFDAIFRFAFADAAPVAGAQSFIGLVNSVFLGSVVPSSIINMIGIGNDGADANMQIMHNAGAGVATKVDLGASFPANTSATDVYEMRLTTVSTTSVNYTVTNLTTGATTSGNISTNTPAVATPLTAYFTRNNNATALSVILAFSQFYINTPY